MVLKKITLKMSRMKNSWMSVMLLLIGLSSCYYDKKETLYPADNSACDSKNSTFSQQVLPILDKKCSSCHGAGVYQSLGGGYNLDGFTNVSNYSSANGVIIKSIKGDPSVSSMPPTGKLTDCEISKIQNWIDNGAGNN
jgi:hypothetical protein